MEVRVGITIKLDKIFSKKQDAINSEIKTELVVSSDYYLLHAELLPKQVNNKGFDVCKTLNSILPNIELVENKIFVEKAGFFTFGKKSEANTKENKKIELLFPFSPIPSKISENISSADGVTLFWFSMSVDNVSLFGSVIELGVSNNEINNKLLFYAKLESKRDSTINNIKIGEKDTVFGNNGVALSNSLKESVYISNLPAFRLFGFFEFNKTYVEYKLLQLNDVSEDNLLISGEISIELFENRYLFKGEVVVKRSENKNHFFAEFMSVNNSPITNIFNGRMVGIYFSDVSFKFKAIRHSLDKKNEFNRNLNETEFWIQGKVEINKVKIRGIILLNGTKPTLAKVIVEEVLFISDVFKQCIGEEWPKDLIDLRFLKGTELYYCEKEYKTSINSSDHNVLDHSKFDYIPGFHINAKIVLTLIVDIPIEGDIIISSMGVAASIQLKSPINLYTLIIFDPNGNTLQGPILNITRHNKHGYLMRLQASLIFMNMDFGSNLVVELKKIQGDISIKSELETILDIGVYIKKGTKVSVSYSKKQGFKTKFHSNFDFISENFDLLRKIKKIYDNSKSPCGIITDFIFSERMKTKFKLSVSFGAGGDEQDIFIFLNGKYEIHFNDYLIDTINLPKLAGYKLDPKSDINNLHKIIDDVLVSFSETIISGLLENTYAMVKIMAIFAGENAIKYTAYFLCKRLINVKVFDILKIGFDFNKVGGIGGAVASFFEALKSSDDNNINNMLEDLLLKIEETIDFYEKTPKTKLDKPHDPYMKYIESILGVHWLGGTDITSFEVELFDPNSQLIDRKETLWDSYEVYFDIKSDWQVGLYQVIINWINEDYQKEGISLFFEKLHFPENIIVNIDRLHINTPTVHITWDAIINVKHYELSVLHNGKLWRDRLTVIDNFLTLKIDDSWFEGEYDLELRSIGNESTLPSSVIKGPKFIRIATPIELRAIAKQDMIEISWNHISNAKKYWVEIVDDQNGKTLKELQFIIIENFVLSKILLDRHFGLITITVIADSGLDIPSLPSNSISIAIPHIISDRGIAESSYKFSINASDCALEIIENFREITSNELAMAMAIASYHAESTANGLITVFPDMSPNKLAKILKDTYSAFLPIIEKTWTLYYANKSSIESSKFILEQKPDLMIHEMSKILATAGYDPEQTAEGLLATWPKVDALELAKILKDTYHNFNVRPMLKT